MEASRHEDPPQEQGEISILDYARLHGLAKDYTSSRAIDERYLPSPPSDLLGSFVNDTDLPELHLPEPVAIEEKWSLDNQGAGFLMGVLSFANESIASDYPNNRYQWRESKMDSPLLSTDPSLDMAVLLRRRQNELTPIVGGLEVEDTQESERDMAALQWPTHDLDLLPGIIRALESEKLVVTAGTVHYLRSVTAVKQDESDDELPDPNAIQNHWEVRSHYVS